MNYSPNDQDPISQLTPELILLILEELPLVDIKRLVRTNRFWTGWIEAERDKLYTNILRKTPAEERLEQLQIAARDARNLAEMNTIAAHARDEFFPERNDQLAVLVDLMANERCTDVPVDAILDNLSPNDIPAVIPQNQQSRGRRNTALNYYERILVGALKKLEITATQIGKALIKCDANHLPSVGKRANVLVAAISSANTTDAHAVDILTRLNNDVQFSRVLRRNVLDAFARSPWLTRDRFIAIIDQFFATVPERLPGMRAEIANAFARARDIPDGIRDALIERINPQNIPVAANRVTNFEHVATDRETNSKQAGAVLASLTPQDFPNRVDRRNVVNALSGNHRLTHQQIDEILAHVENWPSVDRTFVSSPLARNPRTSHVQLGKILTSCLQDANAAEWELETIMSDVGQSAAATTELLDIIRLNANQNRLPTSERRSAVVGVLLANSWLSDSQFHETLETHVRNPNTRLPPDGVVRVLASAARSVNADRLQTVLDEFARPEHQFNFHQKLAVIKEVAANDQISSAQITHLIAAIRSENWPNFPTPAEALNALGRNPKIRPEHFAGLQAEIRRLSDPHERAQSYRYAAENPRFTDDEVREIVDDVMNDDGLTSQHQEHVLLAAGINSSVTPGLTDIILNMFPRTEDFPGLSQWGGMLAEAAGKQGIGGERLNEIILEASRLTPPLRGVYALQRAAEMFQK